MQKLSDYDYVLPPELIATHPVSPRDAARLLVWPAVAGGAAAHKTFVDLPDLLQPNDILVVNSSKVIPARLFATRPRLDGAGVPTGDDMTFEILLHRPLENVTAWECFIKNSKRLKVGQTLAVIGGAVVTVRAKGAGVVEIEFALAEADVFGYLEAHGEMPLPPYIARPDGAEAADKDEYQTVYAKTEGSVAAPTAGLHFTPALLEKLRARGVDFAEVTLHVGAGTFQPVQTEDISNHTMHAEWGEVTADTVAKIKAAQARGGRVIAVGTTTTRLLESAASQNEAGELHPFCGDTAIFMTPGYTFKVVDGLITNFHLPKSTLLMLVAALIGFEEMHALYRTAIAEKYRFYSYGDGCLLLRAESL